MRCGFASPYVPVWMGFVLVLGVLSWAGMGLHLFPDGVDRRDIFVFHAAAEMILERGISPYEAAGHEDMSAELGFPAWPFFHPPASIPYFLPFGWLDQHQAMLANLVLNISLAALCLTLLLKWLQPWYGNLLWPLALVFILSLTPATFQTLWLGQVNFVVLAGTMLMLVYPRTWPAGFGFFAAILLKLYPAILIPVLLRHRYYKAVMVALVLIALAVGLSLLLFPIVWQWEWIKQSVDFTSDIKASGPLEAYLRRGNQSWSGLVYRHLQFNDDFLYLAALSPHMKAVFVMGGTLLLAGLTYGPLLRRECGSREQNLMTGLSLISLIAPIVWGHHSVFIFPVMVWLLTATSQQRDWLRFGLTLTATTLILYRTVLSDLDDPLGIFSSLPFFANLVLWRLTQLVPPPRILPVSAHATVSATPS